MKPGRQARPPARQALIIFGPPGAGKGTQAELLSKRFFFFHVDTGRSIERILYAPGAENDPVLVRERKKFESGELCTPSWVLSIMRDRVMRLALADVSVVFSGYPREEFQAFGDGKEQGLLDLLAAEYGKERMTVIQLLVPSEESMKRNSTRLICSVCGLPVMGVGSSDPIQVACNFCGGKLMQRSLDNPEDIRARLEVYKKQTFPLIERMRAYGIAVHEVNGVGAPYEIHETLVKLLELA
ncbi:hypothetical protein A2110_00740 [Candidatus Jorgensenbacteria bacterium GWA1_54_12]|uniref:Adenylate kinase n=1 Tax=Candidatus Jorgensenbacteria bacterium GWA1_54_12 TaxID=1798468 RepID=A0A1F6BL99_9BACT|nr:MAG: hypothetical protein A2110_00740 [Candidatus Jorgensenbacteria bacterium GWA1_54_12]